MDELLRRITENSKYIIRSADNKIIITFEKRDKDFCVEFIDSHGKKRFHMGRWLDYVDFLQLLYHYEIHGHGNVKNIQGFKQAKLKYQSGSHKLEDGSVHQDKWIFDREILIGSGETTFYSVDLD
ncbi:putative ORFan [Tupanvirus deep ocean]|uniref:ORFan n=2 Tax=Tupanvirus TaxID=2094720 RepID=A0AC62A6U3_9VIRU|nr:putative ORFan [Tupanvirus deep ocean]QKU33491.1 putative ORFan [Tupanvirus deep ocean]